MVSKLLNCYCRATCALVTSLLSTSIMTRLNCSSVSFTNFSPQPSVTVSRPSGCSVQLSSLVYC